MHDYSHHQGPSKEWDDFVKVNPTISAGLTPGETIFQLRERTNSKRERASRLEVESNGYLSSVSWDDVSIPTRDGDYIPGRIYRPRDHKASDNSLPVYLFFHGGGFMFGSIDSEDANCARIVAASPRKLIVLSVCYRHTPEFTYPTQINDAWDAFNWLSKNTSSTGVDSSRIIVGGVSSGGGLAAYVALRHTQDCLVGHSAQPQLRIIGQLLAIPWLIHPEVHPYGHEPLSSIQQNHHSAVLPRPQLDMFARYLELKDPSDANFNIALTPEGELAGLPKTSILAAGMDILRDDALIYADKLRNKGIPLRQYVFDGLPHGFRRFGSLQSCKKWDLLIIESIEWFLDRVID